MKWRKEQMELKFNGNPFSRKWALGRLIKEYNEYGRIIVAYDFDDTVSCNHSENDDSCKMVRILLRVCSKYKDDIDMICYTCRGDKEVESDVIPFLDRYEIRHDKINENSDHITEETRKTLSQKPIYSIFLDDKAGLYWSYNILADFIRWLKYIKGEVDHIYVSG